MVRGVFGFMGVMMMIMPWLIVFVVGQMNIELYTSDGSFLSAGDMQVITIEGQLFQFMLQVVAIYSEIDECAEKHVAANSAEDVEIQSFHLAARAFIWLAA